MATRIPRTILLCLISVILFACTTVEPINETSNQPQVETQGQANPVNSEGDPYFRPTHLPGALLPSPTPDLSRQLPSPAQKIDHYTVQSGDTLKIISQRLGIPLKQLINANQITNPDLISVGQLLTVPIPTPLPPPDPFKIIPDSELVDGPNIRYFNLHLFIQSQKGILKTYSETVDHQLMIGEDIVNRVAVENSVNPRLILSFLEFQSAWVTQPNPSASTLKFPLGYQDSYRQGLYLQLSWAANTLNRGYYLWKINALKGWALMDGSFVLPPPTINAGTAGVGLLLGELYGYPEWIKAMGPDGLFATYQNLFGYPFDYAIEPLIPSPLVQPALQLPFEDNTTWSFTGGPHEGWADGSAWAAIDFAPPGEGKGCVDSDAWVTAVSDASVVYSQFGVVILDLDQDGYQQTGWSVLYLHIASRDRVSSGTAVHSGDRIGHPSCEGGVSNGTHVHLARRYNGEWISADGSVPFNLDGWISSGDGTQYNGFLKKGANVVEAWDSQKTENQIHR